MAIKLTDKQIQNGWKMVRFAEIAKNISQRIEPSETNLNVYVGLEHLDPQSLRITRRGVPSDVQGQKLRVRPGQIIFGKRRAYQKKVAVADFDGICSAHAMVLEAIPGKIIPELLPFFMQSDMFMDRAVAISEGSLSPTIKWKTLAIQQFPLPSLDRQEKILEVLQKVEESLTLYEDSSELASTAKRVVLNDFFQRISKNKKLIVSGNNLYKIGGGNAPLEFNFNNKGDTIYVKVDCFNDSKNLFDIRFSEWKFNRQEVSQRVNIYSKGSIIFPKRGAAIFKNRVGILGSDAAVDSNIMVLQCGERIVADYLKQFLLWLNLSKISDNSGIPQLNNKHLYPLGIPTATVPEQISIADVANKFDSFQINFNEREKGYLSLKQHILLKSFFIEGVQ